MAKIDHANIGDVAKTKYLMGTIVSTDSENDTCEVAVTGIGVQSGVPIFYHCEAASVTRANGALEGGSGAFATDDEVIVQNKDGVLKVVGFADGSKKPCGGGWQFKIRDWNFNSDVDFEEALLVANPAAETVDSVINFFAEFWVWFDDQSFRGMGANFFRGPGEEGFETLFINQFMWSSPGGEEVLSTGGGDDVSFCTYNEATKIFQINTKHPSFISQVDLDVPEDLVGYHPFVQVRFRYEGPSNPPGFQNETFWAEYPDSPVFTWTGPPVNEGPVYTFPWKDNFFAT